MSELATPYERHIQVLRVPIGRSYLTPREYQIVSLLSEGDTPKQVAGKLCRSRKTVERLLRNALERTGAKSSHQLVAMLVAATYET